MVFFRLWKVHIYMKLCYKNGSTDDNVGFPVPRLDLDWNIWSSTS